jgi:hypothetical protein
MSGPPPPPRAAVDDSLREQWIAELRALETPELLALCLTMHGSRQRMRLYLTLLRIRMGVWAQLASCLVCFDLARQGAELAQREFSALAPTIVELARDPTLTADLLARAPFLRAAALRAPLVPAAAGMACLGQLFLATHLG